jgi:EmrB/QacA subfamily drug resistance transporter
MIPVIVMIIVTSIFHNLMKDERRRWLVLVVVCFGQLMIVLDTTIVNVALPAIQGDLGFSQSSLTWVVNAYLIAFGSFLLLAGRLSDLLGSRRVFLTGIVVFTAASAACGLATSPAMLIAGRFAQGFGAALTAAVVLAIVVTEFPQLTDRRRAMGVYTFVATAGGSIGLLAGGLLTQSIDWHWIFFINLPIGLATLAAARVLIEARPPVAAGTRIDGAGAALITLATMVGVYAIVGAADHGWGSASTLGFGATALALLTVFAVVEARSSHPLVPPAIFRVRSLMASSAVRATLVTGMFATFFLGSLYLERVRGFDAIEIGLSFLPMPLTVGLFSVSLTQRIVRRVGTVPTLLAGLTLVLAALALLTTAGPDTAYFPTFGIAFGLMGMGMGLSFTPLLELSMSDVPADDVGLASGIVQVSMQIAGAFGLAVLSTVATGQTQAEIGDGVARATAFTDGFTLACTVGAIAVSAGIVVALTALRGGRGGGDVVLVGRREESPQAMAA